MVVIYLPMFFSDIGQHKALLDNADGFLKRNGIDLNDPDWRCHVPLLMYHSIRDK